MDSSGLEDGMARQPICGHCGHDHFKYIHRSGTIRLGFLCANCGRGYNRECECELQWCEHSPSRDQSGSSEMRGE